MNQSERDALLKAWKDAKAALATLKETEMELRERVAKEFFSTPEKGTQRVDLGFGYNLKLVHKLNYILSGNDEVDRALDEMANTGNEGAFLVDRVISWKPTLSVKEYEILPSIYKKIIDRVLTTKEAAPTLELEEPKEKKK